MPTKPFSEIRADQALLDEIQDKARSGEVELPDSVVEDATTTASGLPELESDEAKLFIKAVEDRFGLQHRGEADDADVSGPTKPAA